MRSVRSSWWKENLRMSHSTFTIVCNELCPHIARQSTHLRETISVEQRVAVTIWKLPSNTEYRTLAGMFGIGRSTANEIVNDTAKQIVTHLLPKYAKIPNGDQLREIVEGLNLFWDFHKLWVLSMVLTFQSFVHNIIQQIIITEKVFIQ